MLVLARKLHEQIVIGDGIVVRVVRISGDRVRLGIIAPKGTIVHRQEVSDKIARKSGAQVDLHGKTANTEILASEEDEDV